MKRTCKQCGKEFFISQSEIKFYKEKNLNIPRRCKECRDANKQKRNDDTPPVAKTQIKSSYNDSDNDKRNSEAVNSKKTNSVKKYLVSTAAVILLGISAVFGANEFGNDGNSSSDVQYTVEKEYYFANEDLLNEHFEKHGIEMGFKSAKEYEQAASAVINNPAALEKTEKEDGDFIYYIEKTNEFVVVSAKTGYIRSYFCPSDKKDYFDRQ